MYGPLLELISLINDQILDISRKAHLFSSQDASVIALSAFEFNVQDWELGNESKLISAWPSGFPRVDGVFICYDCSRPSSFTHVLQLLSKTFSILLDMVFSN